MLETLLQLGLWEYLSIGSAILWLLLLVLWILSQRKVKQVSKELASIQLDNQKKLSIIQEKFTKERAAERRELEQTKDLFVERLKSMKEEGEKRMTFLLEDSKKKIEQLLVENEKEKHLLVEEKKRILTDLQNEANEQIGKIQQKYERQFGLIQDENAKLIDQMNRMAILPHPMRSSTKGPSQEEILRLLQEMKIQLAQNKSEIEALKMKFNQ